MTDEELAELRRRAEAGDALAQCMLGWEYVNNATLTGGWTQAVYWWRKAVVQGNAAAQAALASAYEVGEGVPKDSARAADLLRASAVNGFFVAQQEIGNAYANGGGVPQDYVEAYKWLTLACWNAPVADLRITPADSLTDKMTPAEVAEAQQRAQDWMMLFEKRKA